MPAQIAVMGTGTLQLASITFRPELGMKSGAVIPLGLFAEIVIPGRVRSLGLIARTELDQLENTLLDTIGQRMLANPFGYLLTEFEAAWKESSAGEALAFLANRHRYSLRLETTETTELPRSLFIDGKPALPLVRGHLLKTLDDRGANILRPLTHVPAEEEPSPETGTTEITIPLAA